MSHVLRCYPYDTLLTGIVEARGCRFRDARGRSWLDLESGVWVCGLGHGHPRVQQALAGQARRVMHTGYRWTCDVVEKAAAELLATLSWPDGRCEFLSSGSEAVEFAVQAIRRLRDEPLLLTLADSYLAAYGSAARRDPAAWHAFDWRACAACPRREACDAACPLIAAVPLERIGGFVLEPGNAGGRVQLAPAGPVGVLAREVQRRGGLVAVDEVTTGLGRTGAWYGFQHHGVRPDLVALGKGLGNGFPVSAVAMTAGTADTLVASGLRYAQSHQDDPAGCAVVRAVLAVLREEDLVARSARVGAWLLDGLAALAARHGVVREARGRGLLTALEFEPDGRGWSLAGVFADLVEAGFLPGFKPEYNLLRCYPPLTIAEEDLARFLEALDRILASRAGR